MGRNENSGEHYFFHVLSALVFAAVCAWCAAALYGVVTGVPAPASPTPAAEKSAAGRFRGLLLRREERLPAGAFPDAESGARLSALETGTESALFFPTCDGWETLAPEDADALTPERLEALLNEASSAAEAAPRLVYGFTILCAALFEGGETPAPGPCALYTDGFDAPLRAELLTVTADALGRRMLCLRLTDFPEALYERRVIAGEIR